MRADRLLSLVLLLRNRGRMSAAALARELEVSERTVLRDIDALSTSGFPVYAERGRCGGFELLPGFTTDLTGLTIAEATALLSPMASESLGMRPAFASAMRKVAASMPDEHRRVATVVAARVLVRNDGWLNDAEPDANLGVVQQAVFSGRRLFVEYAGRSGTVSQRTLDPLGLVCAAGVWYLLARHRGNDRTFRLSRMQVVRALPDPAQRPETIDLAELWDSRRTAFRSTREFVRVVIRVRDDVVDAMGAAAVRVVGAAPDTNGWQKLDLIFGGEGHAGSVLWSFGDAVELIEPSELRARIAERGRALTRAHTTDR